MITYSQTYTRLDTKWYFKRAGQTYEVTHHLSLSWIPKSGILELDAPIMATLKHDKLADSLIKALKENTGINTSKRKRRQLIKELKEKTPGHISLG